MCDIESELSDRATLDRPWSHDSHLSLLCGRWSAEQPSRGPPDERNLLGRATPIAHRFRSMDDEREPMDHSPRGRTLCLGKHSTSTTSSEGTQQADRPRVNSFTFSLATDPLVALGVVPSRTGRAGVRYWTAVRSIVSAMLVSSTRGVGYRAVHRRDLHVRRSDRGTPRSRS